MGNENSWSDDDGEKVVDRVVSFGGGASDGDDGRVDERSGRATETVETIRTTEREKGYQRTVLERSDTTRDRCASSLFAWWILFATVDATESHRGVRESEFRRRSRTILSTPHVCVFTRWFVASVCERVQFGRDRKHGGTDIREEARVRRVRRERGVRKRYEL